MFVVLLIYIIGYKNSKGYIFFSILLTINNYNFKHPPYMTFKLTIMYLLYLLTKAIIMIKILISTIRFLFNILLFIININGVSLKRKGSTLIKYSFIFFNEYQGKFLQQTEKNTLIIEFNVSLYRYNYNKLVIFINN